MSQTLPTLEQLKGGSKLSRSFLRLPLVAVGLTVTVACGHASALSDEAYRDLCPALTSPYRQYGLGIHTEEALLRVDPTDANRDRARSYYSASATSMALVAARAEDAKLRSAVKLVAAEHTKIVVAISGAPPPNANGIGYRMSSVQSDQSISAGYNHAVAYVHDIASRYCNTSLG